MSDVEIRPSTALARQQPAHPFSQVNRLAAALLPDPKLADATTALAQELLDDHGRGQVLRREVSFELAAARTRLRVHQALLDDLLTKSIKTGSTPRVLRVLLDLVGREEKHLLHVMDLYSRLSVGAPRVTINAQQAAVLVSAGGDR